MFSTTRQLQHKVPSHVCLKCQRFLLRRARQGHSRTGDANTISTTTLHERASPAPTSVVLLPYATGSAPRPAADRQRRPHPSTLRVRPYSSEVDNTAIDRVAKSKPKRRRRRSKQAAGEGAPTSESKPELESTAIKRAGDEDIATSCRGSASKKRAGNEDLAITEPKPKRKPMLSKRAGAKDAIKAVALSELDGSPTQSKAAADGGGTHLNATSNVTASRKSGSVSVGDAVVGQRVADTNNDVTAETPEIITKSSEVGERAADQDVPDIRQVTQRRVKARGYLIRRLTYGSKVNVSSVAGTSPAPSARKAPSSKQEMLQARRAAARTSAEAIGQWGAIITRGLTKLEPITIDAKMHAIEPIKTVQPPIPRLAHNLDRVLFNPGVYRLRDSYSAVYNFDPYLEKVMPAEEFDFSALKEYKTSSEDSALSSIARAQGKKYVGSTSSMTAVLSQFHFLLSRGRPLNLNMLSRSFRPDSNRYTKIASAPQSIFLRWRDGTYAIDADKEHDNPNILMLLGKSMEKLLTMSKTEFERYRKSNPDKVPESWRQDPEPFQYSKFQDLLMRSQLDTFDPRLPRNGTFDLKTRTVLSIRMDHESEESRGYELISLTGQYMSYEREYFDMLRATMLKYMLQVRMGRMEGIFVAYHNIERIFGFQFIPLKDIDLAIHGTDDVRLGNAEFKMSLSMLNDVLNRATQRFPERSLRILFETFGTAPNSAMRIFAEPVDDEQIDAIQDHSKQKAAEYERRILRGETADALEKSKEQGSASANADGELDSAAYVPAAQSNKMPVSVPVTEDGKQQTVSQSDSSGNSAAANTRSESTEQPNATLDEHIMPSVSDHAIDAHPEELPIVIGDITSHLSSGKEEQTQDEPEGPLFAAVITTETTINGNKSIRPKRWAPQIDWKVTYTVNEYPEKSAKQAWIKYRMTRKRREKILTEHSTGEDGEGPSEATVSYYIRRLRKMAEKSRQWRKQQEALLENKRVKVL